MLCRLLLCFSVCLYALLPAAAQSGAATGVRRAAVYEYETRPDDEEFIPFHPRKAPSQDHCYWSKVIAWHLW